MICTPCTATKTLPDCFESLIVGEVGEAETDYHVYIKDSTTGRVERYEATSDTDKILTIEVTQRLAVNHSYEVWVTLADGSSDDREDVIVEGDTDTHTCFTLRVESTYGEEGKNTFEEVTLTAAV